MKNLDNNLQTEDIGQLYQNRSSVLQKPGLLSRLFNVSVFLFTLFASAAIIIFVALATPFVVVLSFVAEIFDGDDASKGVWTSVKATENAQ